MRDVFCFFAQYLVFTANRTPIKGLQISMYNQVYSKHIWIKIHIRNSY